MNPNQWATKRSSQRLHCMILLDEICHPQFTPGGKLMKQCSDCYEAYKAGVREI